MRASNINPLGIHWQRFIVAEDGREARIVGIGQIKVHGDGSRELASIATVPDRQGEGIATAIIEALLEADAASRGRSISRAGHTMKPFYERFGFRRVERPGRHAALLPQADAPRPMNAAIAIGRALRN